MSSAVNGRNETVQNGAVRESPARGSSVLVELSSNTAHHCELFNIQDHDTVKGKSKGAHGVPQSHDHRTFEESPARATQTHPSFPNPVGQSNDSDTETLSAERPEDHDLTNDKNAKPSFFPESEYCSKEDTPSAGSNLNSFSEPHSHPSRDELNGECEVLMEKQNLNQRSSPFKSILKKSCLTSGTLSPNSDVPLSPSHDVNVHQVTFHETELPFKMADPDQQDSGSGYGLIVSIPIQEERKMSRKHIAQLAAMSGCGFILVSLILAWVFSPTFL